MDDLLDMMMVVQILFYVHVVVYHMLDLVHNIILHVDDVDEVDENHYIVHHSHLLMLVNLEFLLIPFVKQIQVQLIMLLLILH